MARIKWRPTCKAGFEITSPNDLQSQTELASWFYQAHIRLSIQERLTDKTSPPQRCVLPRSNDRRHIHVYLHTHVSTNQGQYVLQHEPAISRARARFGGANGTRGIVCLGKGRCRTNPRSSPDVQLFPGGRGIPITNTGSLIENCRVSAQLVSLSPRLPAIYSLPLVKKMKVAVTKECFLC